MDEQTTKRTRVRSFAAALIWVIAATIALPAGAQGDVSADIERTRTERDEVRREQAEAAATLDPLEAADVDLEAALAVLDENVAVAQARLEATIQALDIALAEAADAQARVDETESEIGRLKDLLRSQAVEVYMDPDGGFLRHVLTSEDFNRAARRRALLSEVTASEADLVDEIRRANQKLADEQEAASRAVEVVEEREAQQRQQIADLEQARDDQQRVRDALIDRIVALRDEIDALEAADGELTALLISLVEEEERQQAAEFAAYQAALAQQQAALTPPPPVPVPAPAPAPAPAQPAPEEPAPGEPAPGEPGPEEPAPEEPGPEEPAPGEPGPEEPGPEEPGPEEPAPEEPAPEEPAPEEPGPEEPAPEEPAPQPTAEPTPVPTPVPTPEPPPPPPPPPPPASTSLIWPVGGIVTSEFGYRWGRPHNGIDISAPSGSAIAAAGSGVVVSAGDSGNGYGLWVVIDHGGGLATVYAHLSSIWVGAGQSVGQGAGIGGLGCTGSCTGPHLHFEVRSYGVPQNPRNFL